jgi:hypothetical protein
MVTVEEVRPGYWLVKQFRNGAWRSTRFMGNYDNHRAPAPERAANFAKQLIDEAAARYSTATMRVWK